MSLLELRPSECECQKVHDLMVDDGSTWDVFNVHTLFPIEIVRRIVSTSIASYRSDTLFWEDTTHGNFTVRDAYKKGLANIGLTNDLSNLSILKLFLSLWEGNYHDDGEDIYLAYLLIAANNINSEGEVILSGAKHVEYSQSAIMAEAEVVCWAVKTGQEKQLTRIERSGNAVDHSIARWALGDNVYYVVDGLVHLESSFCALADDS
ncbi:hypothetical protein Tco_1018504 [Tanacetum coccineum]|uniref:Uncharacterized protein n=1 Tax=Tanacetum coccineum TaxID=301880 RepID=A0ABQ5FVK8_9ASTR